MYHQIVSGEELARDWGCSLSALKVREKQGLLKRAIGVPGLWYTAASVSRCEGMEMDENPMSPFERRRLEARIRELEKQLAVYEDQFYFIQEAMQRSQKAIEHGKEAKDKWEKEKIVLLRQRSRSES